ncbi:hypothetical protein C8035_v010951 [Colletotrichum spinosum]|uniref:Uncharacterized protein n=1 Tax=Colletotrichum spinosum TaxID=1347390 RepID=A0A4R8Q5K8_9PEZI|nr:hypothetical protein C8035_v010951 [Colletotrichum spinosum]
MVDARLQSTQAIASLDPKSEDLSYSTPVFSRSLTRKLCQRSLARRRREEKAKGRIRGHFNRLMTSCHIIEHPDIADGIDQNTQLFLTMASRRILPSARRLK